MKNAMIRKNKSNNDGPKRKKAKTEIKGNARIDDLLNAIKTKKERVDRFNALVSENGLAKLFDGQIRQKHENKNIVLEVTQFRKVDGGDYQLCVTDHVNESNMVLLVEGARQTVEMEELHPHALIRVIDYEIDVVGVRLHGEDEQVVTQQHAVFVKRVEMVDPGHGRKAHQERDRFVIVVEYDNEKWKKKWERACETKAEASKFSKTNDKSSIQSNNEETHKLAGYCNIDLSRSAKFCSDNATPMIENTTKSTIWNSQYQTRKHQQQQEPQYEAIEWSQRFLASIENVEVGASNENFRYYWILRLRIMDKSRKSIVVAIPNHLNYLAEESKLKTNQIIDVEIEPILDRSSSLLAFAKFMIRRVNGTWMKPEELPFDEEMTDESSNDGKLQSRLDTLSLKINL